MSFPEGFVWGAASSSYQIEGGAYDDGKGMNIWDVFCRKQGKISNGDTGEISTDHYHRYVEDVALMKSMGLTGYRLSISWPRVLPEGTGQVSRAAARSRAQCGGSATRGCKQPPYDYDCYARKEQG